jgi:hypothetical protein
MPLNVTALWRVIPPRPPPHPSTSIPVPGTQSHHSGPGGVESVSVAAVSVDASSPRSRGDRGAKSRHKKEQARSLFSLLRRMSLGRASDPGSDTAEEIEREVREAVLFTLPLQGACRWQCS